MSDKRYKQLGNYIELVQERNKGAYITNLMGVSIAKKFIPSIANIIGTDLSNYRIVHPGNFAFCPVTSRNGEKITIARYKGKDDCIISQAYLPFRVIDENELDPDYLMMWVMRPEFDRYARFHSHGSVRELFSWEEMCNVYLPIPSIEEQRKIVAEYQAVEQRIENNNRLIKALEDTAQAIYHHTFVENIDPENLPEGWRWKNLFDVSNVIYGYPFNSDLFCDNDSLLPIVRIRDIVENRTCTYTTEKVDDRYSINDGDILIGMDGNFHMTVWSGGFALQNQRIVRLFPKNNNVPLLQIFYSIKPIIENLEKSIEGTTVAHLGDKNLKQIEMLIAKDEIQRKVCSELNILFYNILSHKKENLILYKLRNILLSKLS